MNAVFTAVLLFFVVIYGLLNYYVGLRGYGYLAFFFPGLHGLAYWSVFWLLAWSYFLGMWLKGVLPFVLEVFLTRLGAYWLAAVVYLSLLFAAADVVRLWFPQAGPKLAVGAVIITALLLVYGTWNALNPRVVKYSVNIPKKAGPLTDLWVAVVSDIHLGGEVGMQRLYRLVDTLNELKPDLVLLVGDMTDRDFDVLPREQVIRAWRRLRPRFGTYAVLGNHDYYGGIVEELVEDLAQGGIRVLRDETVRLAEGIHLVGRDDRQRGYSTGTARRALSELMPGTETDLPVILLDHQPHNLMEAEELGVDLMLSGHTHKGQMFPFNLITRQVFEVDWGYLRRGNLQVVVSCGYGTWGPPVRLGNHPEVVDLRLCFRQT